MAISNLSTAQKLTRFGGEMDDVIEASNRVRKAFEQLSKSTIDTSGFEEAMAEAAAKQVEVSNMQKESEALRSKLAVKQLQAEEKRKEKQAKKELERIKKYDKYINGDNKLVSAISKSLLARNTTEDGHVQSMLHGVVEGMGTALKNALGDYFDDATKAVTTAASTLAKADIAVNTRFQGASQKFEEIFNSLKDTFNETPLFQLEDLVASIEKLSKEGIASNIEERAFLDTISSQIATTFDATSNTLERIVRMQSKDSTANRLGLEVALTKFLNAKYEDSSYMSDVFDRVTDILFELESQSRSMEESTAIEYTVQEWLGALYSQGLSQNTAENIAKGITYLGTGDVNALASDERTQRLMALAIADAQLDYAQILNEGLDVTKTNQILESIVNILKKFGDTNQSQVVRAQFADLFGVSMSDLQVMSNANAINMLGVGGNHKDGNFMKDLQKSMSTLGDRMHMSSFMENLYRNLVFDVGSDLASNPTTYFIWKINELVEKVTGGINIPSVAGFDVNANVNQLAKLGLVGVDTLTKVPDLIDGIKEASGKADKLWSDYSTIATKVGKNSYAPSANVSLSNITTNTGDLGAVVSKSFEDMNDNATNLFSSSYSETNEVYEKLAAGSTTTAQHTAAIRENTKDSANRLKVIETQTESINSKLASIVGSDTSSDIASDNSSGGKDYSSDSNGTSSGTNGTSNGKTGKTTGTTISNPTTDSLVADILGNMDTPSDIAYAIPSSNNGTQISAQLKESIAKDFGEKLATLSSLSQEEKTKEIAQLISEQSFENIIEGMTNKNVTTINDEQLNMNTSAMYALYKTWATELPKFSGSLAQIQGQQYDWTNEYRQRVNQDSDESNNISDNLNMFDILSLIKDTIDQINITLANQNLLSSIR